MNKEELKPYNALGERHGFWSFYLFTGSTYHWEGRYINNKNIGLFNLYEKGVVFKKIFYII